MDLDKIKPEKISDDSVDKVDDYENDQLGTLKAERYWKTNRDEVIKALRSAEVKIKRAKKLDKNVKKVFKMAQDIKKENSKKEKPGKTLKEFLDYAAGQNIKEDVYQRFGLYDLKKEDLESILGFVKFVKPLIAKSNKELSGIFDTWSSALDRVIEDYPRTFDDYAKEIVRQILDAICELEDEEDEEYMEKLHMATSPFFSSHLDIAIMSKGNKGDYENM